MTPTPSAPKRKKHGVYRDSRQQTAYAWYCPVVDWRFALSRAEVENPFFYCPGCAMDVMDRSFDQILEGRP